MAKHLYGGQSSGTERTRTAGRAAGVRSLFQDGQVNVEKHRHQPPLPETADELSAVARSLGVSEAGAGNAVYPGERAPVTRVKALSQYGIRAFRMA